MDFVERHPRQCEVLKENLETVGMTGSAKVHCIDVAKALQNLDGPYSLVLMDPPYKLQTVGQVLDALGDSDLLEDDASPGSGTFQEIGPGRPLREHRKNQQPPIRRQHGGLLLERRALNGRCPISWLLRPRLPWGHVDVATRASNIFEKVIVAVYDTPSKRLMFNTEERVELFRGAVHHIPNVEVKSFSGLVVEAARRLGAKAIVKGLRRGFGLRV